MPSKQIDIPEIGLVTFTKRSSSRSIRLSVTPKGVRVSLPHWTTYGAAERFVRAQTAWIQQKISLAPQPVVLRHGMKIGKQHTLQFESVSTDTSRGSRVTATRIIVRLAPNETETDETAQQRAVAAAKRALKKEVLQLLPGRASAMATAHTLSYASISTKELTRRWGSCDSRKHIIFSLYLMQLPWSQIDYVIAHELAHTVHMDHGAEFWRLVESMQPHARATAKLVRHTQPALKPTQSATAFDDDMAY